MKKLLIRKSSGWRGISKWSRRNTGEKKEVVEKIEGRKDEVRDRRRRWKRWRLRR
jgi:hypothetical protein